MDPKGEFRRKKNEYQPWFFYIQTNIFELIKKGQTKTTTLASCHPSYNPWNLKMITSLNLNIDPENRPGPKRKGVSSNHHFFRVYVKLQGRIWERIQTAFLFFQAVRFQIPAYASHVYICISPSSMLRLKGMPLSHPGAQTSLRITVSKRIGGRSCLWFSGTKTRLLHRWHVFFFEATGDMAIQPENSEKDITNMTLLYGKKRNYCKFLCCLYSNLKLKFENVHYFLTKIKK